MSIVGVFGLALLVVGFGYEMMRTIKSKKCHIARNVVGIFIVSSLILFYYAFTIGSRVFMALNLVLAGVNIVNLYYA